MRSGERIATLTPTAQRLLRLLAERPGRAMSSGALLAAMYPDAGDAAGRNRLKSEVRRLRQRIEADPSRPRLLVTGARPAGYVLCARLIESDAQPELLDGRTLVPEHLRRSLTPCERRLLATLEAGAGRVVDWQALAQAIGAPPTAGFAARGRLKVHVNRLRARIEPDPRRPRLLTTVRGIGYALATEALRWSDHVENSWRASS
jgi:DNA-binding response OmpR family regulator